MQRDSRIATDPAVQAAVDRVSAELHTLVALLTSSPPHASAIADTIVAVEGAGRLMDAARIVVAAPLARDNVAAERLGFAGSVAAVSTLAQTSERTARTRLSLADGITPDLSVSGAPLPPAHVAVAEALLTGRLGVEAATLISRELDSVAPRVPAEPRAVAETMMVNLACGFDPTGQQQLPPVSIDYLSAEIRTIGAAVDPDGALPREERAAHGRSVRVGKQDDDGLFPVRARLVPEIKDLLVGLIEAHRRSPRFIDANDPDEIYSDPFDTRTPDQRRHDALAEILIAAAAVEGAPQLNGQPVTVLVTVRQNDLNDPDGLTSDPIGTMAGSEFPVSREQVDRFIDAGGFRTVTLTPQGAIVGISSPQRCFTPSQTMTIAARDGYRCSAPGCTSPHTALQVHHVIAHRDGGATTTGNGILLCYWHHRRVDDGPWEYRMVDGLPEVRGPGIPQFRRVRPDAARAA